jgi:hypothetical protein
MRTQVKFFLFSATFSLVVAVVYWAVSHERAGSLFLLFMFLAPLLIGGYLVTRASGVRPAEDDPDADHGREAGAAVGRFAARSIWPFVLALGAAVGLEGFVYGVWLMVLGLVLVMGAASGLAAESRG